MKIPKTLQAALPFASKPKNLKKRTKPALESKRAVVLEPHEKKVFTLVQQLNTIRNDKVMGNHSGCSGDPVVHMDNASAYFWCRVSVQAKKRKLQQDERRKAYELKKAQHDEQSKKRRREEIRDRFRGEARQQKKART